MPAADSDAVLPASLPGVDLADGLGHLAGNRGAYRRLLLQFGRENKLLDDLQKALAAEDRQGGTITSKALEAMLREGLVKYEKYFDDNRR